MRESALLVCYVALQSKTIPVQGLSIRVSALVLIFNALSSTTVQGLDVRMVINDDVVGNFKGVITGV